MRKYPRSVSQGTEQFGVQGMPTVEQSAKEFACVAGVVTVWGLNACACGGKGHLSLACRRAPITIQAVAIIAFFGVYLEDSVTTPCVEAGLGTHVSEGFVDCVAACREVGKERVVGSEVGREGGRLLKARQLSVLSFVFDRL